MHGYIIAIRCECCYPDPRRTCFLFVLKVKCFKVVKPLIHVLILVFKFKCSLRSVHNKYKFPCDNIFFVTSPMLFILSVFDVSCFNFPTLMSFNNCSNLYPAILEVCLCVAQDLLRYSEDRNLSKELQEALDCMLVVVKCVNDSLHQVAITGFWVTILRIVQL